MTGFDRSVAFWLRAYPRRWRAVRGAEVTAVLADLAGPDARRLDARAAVGLVRGGWATRWREHPPPRLWWKYRVLRRRLPRPYRAWMRDDVEGFWFPLRMNLALPVMLLPLLWALHSPRPFDRWGMSAFTVVFALMLVALSGRARDTGRRMYRVPPRSEVLAMRPDDQAPRATR